MNPLKQAISLITAICLFLIICPTAATSQNPGAAKPGGEIERLAEQIRAAEAKAKDISSSSPELRQVYNEALAALRAAFDAAVEKEKKQVNDLLQVITEPSARRPLESYLGRLQQKRDIKAEGASAGEFPGGPPIPAGQNGDAHIAPASVQIPAPISANNGPSASPAPVSEQPKPASRSQDGPDAQPHAQPGDTAAPQGDVKATVSGVVTLTGLSLEDRDKTIVTITIQKKGDTQGATFQAKADKDSKFNFSFHPDLPETYTISYESEGYSKLEENIEITAGQTNLRRNLEKASGTVFVIVKDSGTGTPVEKAHVKLAYLRSGDGSSELAQSDEAFVPTNSAGEVRVRILDKAKAYKIIVQKNGYSPYIQEEAFTLAGAPPELIVELVPQGKDYYRAIVGFERSGASSAQSNQNLFLNFFFHRPLIRKNWDEIRELGNKEMNVKDRSDAPKLGAWGDIRITSAPKQAQNIFQSLNTGFNGTLEGLGGLTEFETAVSFIAGAQWRLWSGYLGGNWLTVSAIAGGGALTPFSAENRTETFGIPTDSDRYNALLNRLIQLDPTIDGQTKANPTSEQYRMKKASLDAALQGKKNISFVIQDRDRFLRNYFGGLRLQLASNDVLPVRQVSTFDVTFGQDEAVTAGRFRGGVLRLDGFFPLPFSRSGLIYLFGSASLGFRRAVFSDPLLLPGPDTTILPTNPSAFVFPLAPANRDLYRIGIGVNLVGVKLRP
jgi:hypothetical protein